MTTIHPDYETLAARIVVSNLHKQTKSKFSHVVEDLHSCYNPKTKTKSSLVSEELYDVVMKHKDLIDAAIQDNNDYLFTYFGIRTLEKNYLIRIGEHIVERPQHMFMRTAIGIHGDNIPLVLETYRLMSQKFFIHASPTLFNAGTTRPQMSSCFLVAMKDDSMSGIYDTLKTCALISKHAGGIGLHVHNIRSKGSHIAGTNGTSSGLIPMLKVFNSTARYADQGGSKRPGVFAIYLEPWHGDIFDFLDIRKNHGNEEMRARDIFIALWVPDLFMEKVSNNAEWCLFSPSDAPGLSDVYGKEFEDLYNKYEKEERYQKKVNAMDLWYAILNSQIETGSPFIVYKDACNLKSNHKNLGTIKSSNLCTEIVQYSSPEEVAVCNLASLALPMFVDKDEKSAWFDFEALHAVTKVIVRNLDTIIDKNHYPVPEAETSNKKHRPMAIGVQGFADLLLSLRIPFESDESRKLNTQVFETIYHGAIEASIELAKKYGPYETFKGSPASEGQLQFDLWDHTPTDLWDWDTLKSDLKKYGLRNSLLTGLMPTASTSQILGFNECFEPYTYNIYSRRVLAGEFQITNPWLLRDLSDLGIWNSDMKMRLLKERGSVQNIDTIPDELKTLYKTVWEIPQRAVINLALDRAPFIDQSQSMNIYMKNPTLSKLTSMHFYSWKKGLKTGIYYLRTEAASNPIQFTVDNQAATTTTTIATKTKSNGDLSLSPLREKPLLDKLKIKEYIPVITNKDKRKSRLIAIDESGERIKITKKVPKFYRRLSRSHHHHSNNSNNNDNNHHQHRHHSRNSSQSEPNGTQKKKKREISELEPDDLKDSIDCYSENNSENQKSTKRRLGTIIKTAETETINNSGSSGSSMLSQPVEKTSNASSPSINNVVEEDNSTNSQCSTREASCDMCSG